MELLSTKGVYELLLLTKDELYKIFHEKEKNITSRPHFPDHVANDIRNKNRFWYKDDVLDWANRYRIADDRISPLLPKRVTIPVWPVPETGFIVL